MQKRRKRTAASSRVSTHGVVGRCDANVTRRGCRAARVLSRTDISVMRWRLPGERSKYGNKITNGFHSQKEARRSFDLELLESAGAISNLRRQVPFVLGGIPQITYVADFVYSEGGKQIAEDVKGFLTGVAKIKLAWFRERYGKDWELRIT